MNVRVRMTVTMMHVLMFSDVHKFDICIVRLCNESIASIHNHILIMTERLVDGISGLAFSQVLINASYRGSEITKLNSPYVALITFIGRQHESIGSLRPSHER